MIYDRYLAIGSVAKLRVELQERGILSNKHPVSDPKPFTCGALYWILRNPAYCGDVRHKGKTYPGRQEAIIDRSRWEAVQAQMDGQGGGVCNAKRRKAARMLDGLLYDADDTPLRTGYALRSIKTKEGPVKKRYWYYQARANSGVEAQGSASLPATRLPATAMERIILDTLAIHLADRAWVSDAVRGQDLCVEALTEILAKAKAMAVRLRNGDDGNCEDAVQLVLRKAQLQTGSLTLVLKLDWLLGDNDHVTVPTLPDITVPLHLRQFARNKPIVITTGTGETNRDADLIAMIADARRWMAALQTGEAVSVDALTKSEGKANGVISKMLPLAFLAPDITDAILQGEQPRSLTATHLRSVKSIPAGWNRQRVLLGFDPR